MINRIISGNKQQQRQISFQSIKPMVKLGEDVICEFKGEYPNLKSPSRIVLRILNVSSSLAREISHIEFRPLYFDAKPIPKVGIKMENIPDSLAKDKFLPGLIKTLIDEFTLEKLREKFVYSSPEEYASTAIPLIKNFKVANCGEMALITQSKLLKKGIKANLIGFNIKPKEYYHRVADRACDAHGFVVINVAANALLNKPKTWGSKAVIVDTWLGQCKPAYDMLLEYESIFKINPQRERLEYKNVNRFNIDKYLQVINIKA